MNEVVQEAAQVAMPFLGAGAGAAAHGFAAQTGARLSDGTLRVLEQLRDRLAGRERGGADVAGVLQEALDAGAVTAQDLRMFVGELRPSYGGQRAGRNIVNGSIIAPGGTVNL